MSTEESTNSYGKSVLVDASNLRMGGGVQVAVSFLDELARLIQHEDACRRFEWITALEVRTSSRVAAEVLPSTRTVLDITVTDRYWWHAWEWLPQRRKRYDASFVVFGPHYRARKANVEITGFADVTSVYPWPTGLSRGGMRDQLKRAIRGALSRRLHSRADCLVVETEELKRQVASRTSFPEDRIEVVSNAVNGVFWEPARWRPLDHVPPISPGEKLICYATRPYSHKNLNFLAVVAKEVEKARAGWRPRFVLTLTPDEWNSLPGELRNCSINVGRLSVEQMPTLYEFADAAIFPSLLEAFSVTPLEALHMRTPLFASGREFVRTVCDDAAFYFDPLDPRNCAEVLVHAFSDPALLREKVDRGSMVSGARQSAPHRALRYLEIIESRLKETELRGIAL